MLSRVLLRTKRDIASTILRNVFYKYCSRLSELSYFMSMKKKEKKFR